MRFGSLLRFAVLPLSLLLYAESSHADALRCVDENGVTVLAFGSCPSGHRMLIPDPRCRDGGRCGSPRAPRAPRVVEREAGGCGTFGCTPSLTRAPWDDERAPFDATRRPVEKEIHRSERSPHRRRR